MLGNGAPKLWAGLLQHLQITDDIKCPACPRKSNTHAVWKSQKANLAGRIATHQREKHYVGLQALETIYTGHLDT
ncbi:hypothetical protein M5D96_001025 [Drosophila gunungcola]|uniref:Uncharacterized protein n=1 Tax=Drosophila gunungcola TaxID=103775 RepID=A0A9P9YXQ6_9MUSC|nr:hypothetical protein M5D96_001025 [Drosophila gunungcola]